MLTRNIFFHILSDIDMFIDLQILSVLYLSNKYNNRLVFSSTKQMDFYLSVTIKSLISYFKLLYCNLIFIINHFLIE